MRINNRIPDPVMRKRKAHKINRFLSPRKHLHNLIPAPVLWTEIILKADIININNRIPHPVPAAEHLALKFRKLILVIRSNILRIYNKHIIVIPHPRNRRIIRPHKHNLTVNHTELIMHKLMRTHIRNIIDSEKMLTIILISHKPHINILRLLLKRINNPRKLNIIQSAMNRHIRTLNQPAQPVLASLRRTKKHLRRQISLTGLLFRQNHIPDNRQILHKHKSCNQNQHKKNIPPLHLPSTHHSPSFLLPKLTL